MCWSGEASAVLAVGGLATAAYIANKGESKELWIPLTYFALMELLQASWVQVGKSALHDQDFIFNQKLMINF